MKNLYYFLASKWKMLISIFIPEIQPVKFIKAYKKILLIFALFIFVVTSVSYGETTSGTLTENETWSGTINITGDVTVPEGLTLTISAGAEILFSKQSDDTTGGSDANVSELIVNGSLIVSGTESEPVTFTSDASTKDKGDWGGIRAVWGLGSKTFNLQYCEIAYAANGIYFESSTGIHDFSILSCNIHDHNQDGVYVYATGGARLTVSVIGSTIQDTGRYGVYMYAYGGTSEIDAQVTGNAIRDTGNAGVYIYAYSSTSQNDVQVAGNTVQHAGYYGIYGYVNASNMTIDVSDNDVSETSGNSNYAGIYLNSSSMMWASITGNRVHDNAGTRGINISGGNVDVDITLNEVYGNGHDGICCTTSVSYAADILYNDVHGNGSSGLRLSTGNGANVNYNNFYDNGATYYALQNVSANSVNARYNWWGPDVTAEMDLGGNPKNISRIYDVYDSASYGTVDYAGWLSAGAVLPTQALSKITSPLDGAVMKTVQLRIQGIAVSPAGVKQVAVSLDNGSTWQEATGTDSWSYVWDAPADGTYTLLSRATDNADNVEMPGAGVTITIDSSLPTTSGSLTGDETWDGTVTLTGDVTVPDGVTLTIEPGTTIKAVALNDGVSGGADTSRIELIVNGTLSAEGTEALPIVFTSDAGSPAAGDWSGIRLAPGASGADLILRHCTVQYCKTGVDYQSSGYAAAIELDTCTVEHTIQDGVYVYATSGAKLTLNLTGSTIHHTGRHGLYTYAVGVNSEIDGQVAGNTVTDTGSYGIHVYAYATAATRSDVQVTGNTVERAVSYGIYGSANSSDMAMAVSDNDVSQTAGTGIGLSQYQYSYINTLWAEVTGNRVSANSSRGILISGSSLDAAVTLNQVYGNGHDGIYCTTGAGYPADILYNDVHDNVNSGLNINTGSGANVNYNNFFGNGAGYYAVQNVGANSVNARFNWWGADVTAEMAGGVNPKNISRIYDVYDSAALGTVDYASWLSAAVVLPTQALSRITSPLDGSAMKTAELRIQGIAVAPAGVARVEVSTDNGVSWQEATGIESWRYDWPVPGDGSYTLLSRVIDRDDAIETPGTCVTITIDSSLPTTSGILSEDETWSGTVNITGDVTVPAGVTLTIEPGTTIKAVALNDGVSGGADTSRIELIVNGTLSAEGTEALPIVFTSDAGSPAAGDWSGIRLAPGASGADLILRHCTVQYCKTGVDYQSSGYAAAIELDTCTVEHTIQDGVYVYATSGAKLTLNLTGSTIHHTGRHGLYTYAVGVNSEIDGQVAGNTVTDTGSYGIHVYAYATAATRSDVQVTGNTVERAVSYGIYGSANSSDMAMAVSDNDVSQTAGTGICLGQSGSYTLWAEVTGNRVSANSSRGILISGSSLDAAVTLNQVYGNGHDGIYCTTGAGYPADILYNDVHDNVNSGLNINTGSGANVNYNNFFGNGAGYYAVQNAGANSVNARFNWWGADVTAEMAGGVNPKNISRIYDVYDSAALGTVDYAGWLSAAVVLPTQALSRITSPLDGSAMKTAELRIQGIAVAPAGVARVEVSTDNGVSWQEATGIESWRYDWPVPGDGSYTLLSRVIDRDDAIETPGTCVTITIDSSLPTTSGILSEDETWSGTVNITGDVTVPAGVTLTIAPGTVARATALNDDQGTGSDTSRIELIVNGILNAEGSQASPIVFTSAAGSPAAGDWTGIRLAPGASGADLILRHCTVQYCKTGVDYQSSGYAAAIELDTCTVEHTIQDGVYVYATSGAKLTLNLTGSTIHHTGRHGLYTYAVGVNSEIDGQVTGNTVADTGGYGIYHYSHYTNASQSDVQVTGNTVERAVTYGIYGYASSSDMAMAVSDNDVSQTAGTGIGLSQYQYSYINTLWAEVTGNRVSANSSRGILISGSSLDAAVTLNQVYGNGHDGIYCTTGAGYPADILYNDVHDNVNSGLNINTGSGANVNYNNFFGNGAGYYAVQNVGANSVNARFNWWGADVTAEMAGGVNPKNISRIYDVYDSAALGTVDYASWLSAAVVLPTQALSRITSPLDGSAMKTAELRIQGIAVAPAGVARVEVSTDNGVSWQEATGIESWRYDWPVPGDGSYTLLSRVIDRDDAIETPGTCVTITIDSSLPTTSGILSEDETWSGTVNITGDVTVPAGVTLTIEPGTTIKAVALNDGVSGGADTSRIELIVNGTLSAEGTEALPIVFTSDAGSPAAGDWSGIRLAPGASGADLILRHCTVQYCKTGVDYQSSGYAAAIELDTCTVEHTIQDGVYVYATSGAKLTLNLTGSTIHHTGRHGLYTYAVGVNSEIDGQVAGNTVTDTGSYGIHVYAYATAATRSDVQVTGNTVERAVSYGIYGSAYSSDMAMAVSDNDVSQTAGTGICLGQSGSYTLWAQVMGNRVSANSSRGILISGNSVYAEIMANQSYLNNGSGIYCQGLNVPAIIALNRVRDNGAEGIYCASSAVAKIYHNNLFSNYGHELYNAGSASIDARYNYWGPVITAEMVASGHTDDIAEIFDIYDSASSGAVDYFGWLTEEMPSGIEILSRMVDPVDGSLLASGDFALSGWAYAAAGVDRVEVSLDNGASWQPASIESQYVGRSWWSFAADALADGTYEILSRVVDRQDTVESPGHELTVAIDSQSDTLSGTLKDDETWSGDIQLVGDVTVPYGITLTLLPGTTVRLPARVDGTHGGSNNSKTELIVHGALLAEGSSIQPIVFTSDGGEDSAPGDWQGIYSTGSLILRHITVEYAQTGITAIMEQDADGMTLRNGVVRSSAEDGIYIFCQNSAIVSADIEENTISQNGRYGIHTYVFGGTSALTLQIGLNEIRNNGDDGIYIDTYSGSAATIGLIDANLIQDNTGDGIYFYIHSSSGASDFQVRNNTIDDVATGINAYFYYAGSNCSLDVNGNDVTSSSTGMRVVSANSNIYPTVVDNVVQNNTNDGIRCEWSASESYLFSIRLEDNQVDGNNGNGVYLKVNGSASLRRNSLFDNSLYDIRNDGATGIDAQQNWWGVDTTNQINAGANPKNLSAIFDSFDDASKGEVDYGDWLAIYTTPNPPTLNPVMSPTWGEVIGTYTIPLDGLMAYYPLDGNADDQSVNASHGSLFGAEPTLDRFGQTDGAYLFDGVDDYIVAAADALPTAERTVSFWFKTDTVENRPGMLGYGGNTCGTSWLMGVNLSGAESFRMSSHCNVNTINYNYDRNPTGKWVHYAVTTNAGGATIYVDGMAKAHNTTFVSNTYVAGKELIIGAVIGPDGLGPYTDAGVGYFAGAIDEVCIYDRALVASEIQTLFRAGMPILGQSISGTKDVDTAIINNSTEIVPLDSATAWSYPLPLNEGLNWLSLRSRNADQMTSGSVNATILLDSMAPMVLSSQPADGATVNETVGLVEIVLSEPGTAVDATATIAGATVQDDAAQSISGQWNVANNYVTFTPDVPLESGSYTVFFTPTDTLGNSQSVQLIFGVDMAAPEMPTITGVITPTNLSAQMISGTKESDVAIWLSDTEIVPADDLTEWSYTLNLIEGNNTYRLYARDRAGNVSGDQFFTIILDRAPPSLVSSEPADGAYVQDGPTEIRLVFDDGDTALLEDQTLTDASFQDAAGNEIEGTWAVQHPNIVTFVPSSPLIEETYTTAVQAYDLAGNSASVSIQFTYDITLPAAPTLDPVTSPTNFSVQTLTGTKADDASIWLNDAEVIPVSSATTWSYPITLTEGTNDLEIYSKDRAGNQSASVFATIEYDETAPLPVTNLTADGSGSGTRVALDWSGYDEAIQGDISHYKVYVQDFLFTQVADLTPDQNVPAGTFTCTVSNLVRGTRYYFAVLAVDNKGNTYSSVTPVSTIPVDVLAPEEVTGLDVACFADRLEFSWNHSANSDGDLAGYKVYIDGATDPVLLDAATESFTAEGMAPASSHTLRVATYDADGNESAGVSLTGATLLTNPVISAIAPYSGYVSLSWNAVQPADLVKYYAVYVSPADFSSVAGMTPAKVSTTTSGSVAGLTNNQTYFFAVTTINLSDGEDKSVATVVAMPTPDTQGPEISDVKVNGVLLISGAELSGLSTFTLNATDPAGLSKVMFYIDGGLIATDTDGSSGYAFVWDVLSVADGSHTLDIMAYDTLGNTTTLSYSLSVTLAVPPAPSIGQPSGGELFNQPVIGVSGQAQKGTEVVLYLNGAEVGTWQPVDEEGNFVHSLTLVEEDNQIRAAASNRAGTGPLSAEVLVTLDSSIPDPPGHFTAESRENGVIRLNWSTPLYDSVKGYNLYRAATEFDTKAVATQVNTTLIPGNAYSDLPESDGTWYYRAATVDYAGNESELSNLSGAVADRIPPRASITNTPTGVYDPDTGRMTAGLVNVLLTVTEPLQAEPFLTINPLGATPLSVQLTRQSELEYVGYFVIAQNTPSGTAYAVFSARDLAGNRGTDIDAGQTVLIDTSGPAINEIVIHPAAPVLNSETNPVTVTVTTGLTEPMKPGVLPSLHYLLSGQGRTSVAIDTLAPISTQPGHAETWQGVFVLPADAGLVDAETLTFIYLGVDDLDNESDRILCQNQFQVYQGELPPLAAPTGLAGTSLPQGKIGLSWNEVENASGYDLYRQAPDETELTLLVRLDTVTAYEDAPAADGLYTYAVASVRTDNGQEAVSGLSNPIDVYSDAMAPEAPSNLALELMAQGIKATWQAAPYTEDVTYRLYRSDQAQITSVDGLTAVLSNIAGTTAVDSAPSHTDHCYVVTSVDEAGNESSPSDSVYLNFELLPVATLSVRQTDNDSPVVSWTHAGGSIDGFDFYLNSAKMNQGLLIESAWTDLGYADDERQYAVVAVDTNGHESLSRSIILPVIRASLQEGEVIRRGVMNRVAFVVENRSSFRIDHVRLQADVEGYTHFSETFSLDANSSTEVLVTVGGYADLADVAALVITVFVQPNQGETVEIVCTTEIDVQQGMFLGGIFNDDLLRGGTGQVRFTLENTGEAEIEIVTAEGPETASDEITLYLLDADENVLATARYTQNIGDGVVAILTGQTVARIPAGAVFESAPIDMNIPATAPDDLTIQLVIDQIHHHTGATDHIAMQGFSTTHQVSLSDTSYYGEILNITPENAIGNQEVVITGRSVERATDVPMPYVPLNLVISVDGFERSYTVYTDDIGEFSYSFQPLPGESGLYRVWSVHPDLTDKSVQGEFVISRIGISPSTINLSVPRNYEKTLDLTVTAGSGTEVNNLHLVYDELDQPSGVFPQGVHVTLGPPVDSLSSGESATLSCSVWADNTADQTGTLVFKVKSDETGSGDWGPIVVNAIFSDANPALFYTPDHVETGLTLDDSIVETIVLGNRGLVDLIDVTLEIVSQDVSPVPDWIHCNSAAVQGAIGVGETRDISLSFTPAAGKVTEGMYSCYLRVRSANYPDTDIPVFVTVTQSGIGSAAFKIQDIYTGTVDESTGGVIQGLANAKIEIQNERVLTETYYLTTDTIGESLLTDIPAGSYKYRVSADKHQEYIGRLWIKPGITTSREIFLEYNLVTVEWEVIETTIADKYEIVLNATYETNVPAPVVVAEPASITLPDMKAGDVFNSEFTLTNYGLIRAENLAFQLPSDDQFFRYELVSGLPQSLEAKERITVPYRVTCLRSLTQEEDGSASGGECSTYYKCVQFNYDYTAACDKKFKGTGTYCFLINYGECSGDSPIRPPVRPPSVDIPGGEIVSPPGKIISPVPQPIGPGDDDDCDENDFNGQKEDDKNRQGVGCEVSLENGQFYDDALDLSVKVPGGRIDVKRWFYRNGKKYIWHWEHEGRNNIVRADIFLGGLGSCYNGICSGVAWTLIEIMNKGGVYYYGQESSTWPFPEVESQVYLHGTYKIVQTTYGYLWEDKHGNWKKYDPQGRMTAYGNLNGTIANLLYESGEDGKLIGVFDRNNRQVLWYMRDIGGLITAIQDHTGRRIEYCYDLSLETPQLIKVVNTQIQNETVYQYDDDGRMNHKIDAAGRSTIISYTSKYKVDQVVDANGIGHAFTFGKEAGGIKYAKIKNTSGMVKEIWFEKGMTQRVDINGRTTKKIKYSWRPRNNNDWWFVPVYDFLSCVVTDEKGNNTTKEFDEWQNNTKIIYPDNMESTYEYDLRFNKITRSIDPRDNISTYEYDSLGNLIRKTEASGSAAERAIAYDYDEMGQIIEIVYESDNHTQLSTVSYTYDAEGNLTSILGPEGGLVEFANHDAVGNPSQIKDPRDNHWQYDWDGDGRLISITDPLGNTKALEYDGVNNLTVYIDPDQNRYEFEYDDHNNVITITDPYLNTIRHIYNSDNNRIQTSDQENRQLRYEYDNEGRLLTEIDGAGNQISYHFNENRDPVFSDPWMPVIIPGLTPETSDKPVRIEYPTFTRRLRYDNRQRIKEVVDVLGSESEFSRSFSYDEVGNIISYTDQEGNASNFEYDGLNRLIETTDALGGVTKYRYDDRDNLVEIEDPNNGLTLFEYDRNNRLTKITRPIGEETTFEYDEAGNRTAILDAKGQKVAYEYDSANRLAGIRYYAAGDHSTPIKTVALTYNAIGKIESYDDGTTSALYAYDDLQCKIGETIDYGAFTLSYSYEYYANGLKKSFTGPNGITYSHTYDANNRISAIDIPEQGEITYNSYQWNSPSRITFPGGNHSAYTYDPLMQISGLSHLDPGGNPLVNCLYQHTPAGNIVAKTAEPGIYDYGYDPLHRLILAANPTLADEEYSYDALGNRLTAEGTAGVWDYNANNELLNYGNVNYEYDDNGNMTRKTADGQVADFIYDIQDRLVRVELEGGVTVASYYYNPLGRRLWKEVGGIRTYFFYSDEGLVGEYDAGGNEIKTYGYVPDSIWSTDPLFQKVSGSYYWYQNDHLGTPQKISDTSGRIVWAAFYDTFGNTQIEVNEIKNNLRFPGQYFDAETEFHYNWFRYYDPKIGRYLRTDPVWDYINLYIYSLNNPSITIDSSGLCPTDKPKENSQKEKENNFGPLKKNLKNLPKYQKKPKEPDWLDWLNKHLSPKKNRAPETFKELEEYYNPPWAPLLFPSGENDVLGIRG